MARRARRHRVCQTPILNVPKTKSLTRRKNLVLTPEQRAELEAHSTTGTRPAKSILRARALLLMDLRWTLADIGAALGFSSRALKQIKAEFFAQELTSVIERKPREKTSRALLDEEALSHHIKTLVLSLPPPGRGRWTLRMLREKLLSEKSVESVSLPTIAKILRKLNLDNTTAPRQLRKTARGRSELEPAPKAPPKPVCKIIQYAVEPAMDLKSVRIHFSRAIKTTVDCRV